MPGRVLLVEDEVAQRSDLAEMVTSLGYLVETAADGMEALEKLAAHDAAKAQLVKLRYFVGMTNEEAAAVLGISEKTAKRAWTYAKLWLLASIESSR